ncbi:hypothetical protein SODALDRAFT_379810 [Sodiomyces alkalinus F11]|uniref:Arrestin-like N-terminal domain-containing protein n=1 Tax=Sodiomyces alkalinus (strain CBS 110278 / VKM F-3762 / F11) TaxID=1314773 RepID=A0A3N2PS90_SODAK|nr:hypothetical protein SODALDRAFT_379810 [Sodiomyces alkalinus F11]ROT37340.1 hypothetical protein SODALDRAFT_379810 [Sodiomyces alkalinus F11]
MEGTPSWTARQDRGPINLEVKFNIESDSPFHGGPQRACFVRPGDRIRGTCRISTVLALHDSWAEVSLQGKIHLHPYQIPSRSDESYREVFSAERVEQRSKLGRDYTVEGIRKVYVLPFLFVIPPGLDRTSDQAEATCKPLPPSFKIPTTFSTWSPTPPPEPYITYALRASIEYTASADATANFTKTADIIQPIICLPYIEIQPPVETGCFPDEYILSATQPMWKSMLGRKLGRVTVTTLEPRPLVYGSDQPSATECTFHITAVGNLANLQRLRSMSVEVDPVLQTKTYYSRTRLAGTPQKGFLREGGPIRLHTDVVQLDKHKISNLEWKSKAAVLASQRHSGSETDVFLQELAGDGAKPPSLGGNTRSRQQPSLQSSTIEDDAALWYASVSVRIQPPFQLQPSFCSKSHIPAPYCRIQASSAPTARDLQRYCHMMMTSAALLSGEISKFQTRSPPPTSSVDKLEL